MTKHASHAARILVARVARMIAAATRSSLLAARSAARRRRSRSAATKHGITPISPKAGATVPVGQAPTFKVQRHGPRPGLRPRLQVQEEGHGRRDLPRRRPSGKAKQARAASQRYKPKFFDFPEFWLNTPGTYYWQAHRIACIAGSDRATAGRKGRSSSSRSADGPHRLLRLELRQLEETFYPPRLPARRWLEHYATRFDTVEVNATFYRLASPSAVDGWVHQTPPDFVFAVKSSRYLTHMKRLTDMDRGVGRFYDSIAPLVESPKLGPVLWQLPDRFARDDERLAHALANLPPGRHAFELRHPRWFAEPVYDLLRELRRRVRAPRRQAARARRPMS